MNTASVLRLARSLDGRATLRALRQNGRLRRTGAVLFVALSLQACAPDLSVGEFSCSYRVSDPRIGRDELAKVVVATMRQGGASIETIARQTAGVAQATEPRMILREAAATLPIDDLPDPQATSVHVASCDDAEWIATAFKPGDGQGGTSLTACLFASPAGHRLDVYGVAASPSGAPRALAVTATTTAPDICGSGPGGMQARLQTALKAVIVSTGPVAVSPQTPSPRPSSGDRPAPPSPSKAGG
jgi:hypothetical protein